MKKKSICWNITSLCNENCQYCYKFIAQKENSFYENKKILETLIAAKIERITWTGGEALLYPNIMELLKFAQDNNIKNSLITNGKNLTFEKIDQLEKYVDYITFSIDTTDATVNEKLGRGANHSENIINLINYIINKNINIVLKINSIVTKQNINELEGLANELKDFPIKRWKLFKFNPIRELALTNKEKFDITLEEFEAVMKKLQNKNIPFPIVGCRNEDFENNYILVNPNGDFLITLDGKDKILIEHDKINIKKVMDVLNYGF